MVNEKMTLPNHIAIVMDGNGRWAENKGLYRNQGHKKGEEVFRDTCKLALEKGIQYLTVFAFSTENWKRPQNEVNAIMGILQGFFETCLDMAISNNYRIVVIGDKEKLSPELKAAIDKIEVETNNNTKLTVCIAINYGGRNEIVRSVNNWLKSAKSLTEFKESDLVHNLDTDIMPYPDLVIRTGGEIRLSNFMLWQIAYSELYFSDVLWPDFNEDEFNNALEYYKSRCRRFGNIK